MGAKQATAKKTKLGGMMNGVPVGSQHANANANVMPADTAEITSHGALTDEERARLHNRPTPALLRMIKQGSSVREKQKAKEMRKRSLAGKWDGYR